MNQTLTGPFGAPSAPPSAPTTKPTANADPQPEQYGMAPVMPANIVVRGQHHTTWDDPDRNLIADLYPATVTKPARLTLWERNGNGQLLRTVTGSGPTVRDAYEDAVRRLRLARYDVADLCRDLQKHRISFRIAIEIASIERCDVLRMRKARRRTLRQAARYRRQVAELRGGLDAALTAAVEPESQRDTEAQLAQLTSEAAATITRLEAQLHEKHTAEWSDPLTLAYLRKSWPVLSESQREDLAVRILDDLCRQPHERGIGWIAIVRAAPKGIGITPAEAAAAS